MPFNDGIPKINSFSLTDFHDFDFCQFKFYVRHHLEKKAEIDEGSEQMALGSLLDQSIKKFHKSKAYGVDSSYLPNIVRAAANFMREQVLEKGVNSFFGTTVLFLNEDLIKRASDIFVNYYQGRGGKIRKSLGDVGFCEWIIEQKVLSSQVFDREVQTESAPQDDKRGSVPGDDRKKFKLWGGPDALEMGDDGVAEIVDYKSRETLDKNFDMELMPRIYTLLVAKKLIGMGYDKARFVVRIWQDPKDESIFEEFDLKSLEEDEGLFRQKIERILANKEITFCNRKFCRACNSEKRDTYLEELQKRFGLGIMNGEEFLNA